MTTARADSDSSVREAKARADSVSVIIPASRPEALARCLESLANARTPQLLEYLLVLNNQACAETAQRFADVLPGLRLLEGAPGMTPGAARNLALAGAGGDWLCFLDDDVTVPVDYFRVLADKSRLFPKAAVIGGPNFTPPESPLFARCVGHILGSWLGAGATRRRCAGFTRDQWCDDRGLILCNMLVRREILLRENLRFDLELARNEENLLLERLFQHGHLALHSPDLFVHHERRVDLASFCRQCFLSGQGRARMTRKLPSSLRVFHLLPVLLAVCVIGAPIFPRSLGIAAAGYLLMTLACSPWLALRQRESARAWPLIWLLFPATHLSYAAGFILGLAGRRR